MLVIFALNLFKRDLKVFQTTFIVRDGFSKIKVRINNIHHQFNRKFCKSLMFFHPNYLKSRNQHLELSFFNSINSFMGNLENIPSLLSRSACSNSFEFFYTNGIKDGVHNSSIMFISFICTSTPF